MTFNVKYRANNGSVAFETVDAADRSDCLAKCKKRGIAPISVIEGCASRGTMSKGSTVSRPLAPSRTKITKLVLVLIGIIVAGAGIWMWMSGVETSEPLKKTKAKTIKKIEEKPATVNLSSVTNTVVKVTAEPPPPPVTGKVIKVGFTRQMRTLPDGTKEPLSKPKFTNAIERAFSTLCNPGGMAIPFSVIMRRFSEDEILRIINQPMVYDPTDSDELIERKFAVQQFKDQIREYLKAGNTLQQAIAEVDAASRSENIYRNMSQVGFIEALRTGDGETVRRYVQEQNVELGKRGMRQLTVPLRYRLQEKQQNGETK